MGTWVEGLERTSLKAILSDEDSGFAVFGAKMNEEEEEEEEEEEGAGRRSRP